MEVIYEYWKGKDRFRMGPVQVQQWKISFRSDVIGSKYKKLTWFDWRGQDSPTLAVPIHGEMSSYQTQPNYYRYHLGMPTVPRRSLWIQDLVCCDYFRTPVIFQVPDNLVFVGEITCSAMHLLAFLTGQEFQSDGIELLRAFKLRKMSARVKNMKLSTWYFILSHMSVSHR